MLFGIIAYSLVFVITGISATDIALSDCSVILSKVLFVICKDSSLSDSASMSLFILLELILVLHSLYHMCFIYCLALALPSFVYGLLYYIPLTR